jgi:hypothetical protein
MRPACRGINAFSISLAWASMFSYVFYPLEDCETLLKKYCSVLPPFGKALMLYLLAGLIAERKQQRKLVDQDPSILYCPMNVKAFCLADKIGGNGYRDLA